MKPIDRGDAPPFDLALFAADAVVPKDQRLALDRVPGWFSNAGEEKIAPIDDTPEDYGASASQGGRRTAASPTKASAMRAKSPPRGSPGRGKYMANQRALEMEDESDEEEAEEETARAARAATDADGREFSNVPAPGVAPLVLKSHEALMMATERRKKPKPKIVYDDESDEEIMPTQTASQMPRTSSPSRPRTADQENEPPAPASPLIGIIGRAVNAAAEALGFTSPFKPSAPSSPIVGGLGLASPGAPASLALSPRTMTNVVGSVARSVLDDDDARASDSKVEWGAKGAYASGAKKRGARRALDVGADLDRADVSPTKKTRR